MQGSSSGCRVGAGLELVARPEQGGLSETFWGPSVIHLFTFSFIHSSSNSLLSACHVPNIVQS